MIRYIKALGLVAFAALAMSAMFASAASAQTEGFYTAGDTTKGDPIHTDATVLGEQVGEPTEENNVFLAGGGRVNCHNATFTGTLKEGGTSETPGVSSTNLTIEPHYEECYAEGTQAATVTMNECDYTFTQPTTEEGLEGYTAKAHLYCPEGKAIVIHVYLFGSSTAGTHSFKVCSIEVSPKEGTEQELGGHVILTEGKDEGKDDILANATIEGIHYNDGCHSTSGDDGEYFNTVTLRAFNDDEEPHNEQLDAFISE